MIFMFVSTFVYAQRGPSKFGDVLLEELEVIKYAVDTLAPAVVLFDQGSIKLEPQPSSVAPITTYKRHIRVKILRQAALDEWGSFKIYARHGELSELKAATYNKENGDVKKTSASNKSIFKSRYDKDIDETSIIFPNVKEGSIVECSYVISAYGYYLPDWYFQSNIPVLFSEYSVTCASFKIDFHLRGLFKLNAQLKKNNDTYLYWQMINVPAFKPEPFMPDPAVYKSYIEFSEVGLTWFVMYEGLKRYDRLMGIINSSDHDKLKDTVKIITKDITNKDEIIKSISNYVKKNVEWDNLHYCFGDFPEEVLKRRKGNTADINLLFGCLLNKAGFDAKPVLLSTRKHGYIIEDKPSVSQFNYVVIRVTINGKGALYDATDKDLPYNLIPPKCFNHKGLFIEPRVYYTSDMWIPVEPIQSEKVSVQADLVLLETGGMTGKLSVIKDGYAAFADRKRYGTDSIKDESYIKNLEGMKQWNLQLTSIENRNDINKPIIENYNASVSDYAIISNDLLYFNPFVFLKEEENPFALEIRNYPLDFEATIEKTVVCNILIPDGFEVEEMPKDKILGLPENAAKCIFSVSRSGNKIIAMSRLIVNETLFQPERYAGLKEFYSRIIAKKSENIVLRKR
jgi:hypothetical protein